MVAGVMACATYSVNNPALQQTARTGPTLGQEVSTADGRTTVSTGNCSW